MKIFIGPYRNIITLYHYHDLWLEKLHKKPHWSVEEDEYTRADKIVERIIDLLQWVLNKTINLYLCNLERKIKVKIHNYDTWNMDNTLAHIILPMLIQLKAIKHGIANIDPEDVPHIGKGDETDFGHSDTNAEARWNWVLDEMIFTFDYVASEKDLIEDDSDEARVSNGLRLFGKYYRALWD